MNALWELCKLSIKFIFTLMCILFLFLFFIRLNNFISEKYFEYKTHCKIVEYGSLFRGYNQYTRNLNCEGISDDGYGASVDGYNESKIIGDFLIIKAYGVSSGKYENWCFSKEPKFFIYNIKKKYLFKVNKIEIQKKYYNIIENDFFNQDLNYLKNNKFSNDTYCK